MKSLQACWHRARYPRQTGSSSCTPTSRPKHRLENPGTEMLELIEVQSDGYPGEDDIVRYEDVYGRS
jgi:mannose-6-phosphate isomerase-like protein (cupin superfamily)